VSQRLGVILTAADLIAQLRQDTAGASGEARGESLVGNSGSHGAHHTVSEQTATSLGAYPEDLLKSLGAVVGAEVDEIECNVHSSHDWVLVVNQDRVLDRTKDSSG